MQKEFDEYIKKYEPLKKLAAEILGYLEYKDMGLATTNGTLISIILAIAKFCHYRLP